MKLAPLGYNIIDSIIKTTANDIIFYRKMPYMIVYPMDPSNSFTGHTYGDEYGLWPTRYIGGLDGDVLLSKTLKCNFRF